ncbi:MAG: VOC family protein [Pseudomonadota bacterium]
MIDHITFGVSDFQRSTSFYDQALAPLGLRRLFDVPKEHSNGVNITGYGDLRPWFWMAEEHPTSGMFHVAFQAQSRSEVDAFHAAALRAGGTDNGAPGLRPQYHENYYAAYVFDPDGHNIEAVCGNGP